MTRGRLRSTGPSGGAGRSGSGGAWRWRRCRGGGGHRRPGRSVPGAPPGRAGPRHADRPLHGDGPAAGPHSAPGLIASGTIDGQRWQFAAAKPGSDPSGFNGQMFMTSGPAFERNAGSRPGGALAVDSADPVSFLGLTSGPIQVQYGAVRADVTYVAMRLDNSTVLTLHPVTVYGVRAVAFAIPAGAGIAEAAAYSPHGVVGSMSR